LRTISTIAVQREIWKFAGRALRLPHVISGSGARYSDGKTTFRNRGRSALMEVDDKIVVQDCMLQGKP